MPSVIYHDDGSKIVKTNCFDCHSKCGVLCHVDAQGVLTKVEGNPEDPRSQGRMCPKGRSAVKILNDPDRINYPMRRKGERGGGQWERITWDEALDEIETRCRQYMEMDGPRSIVFGQGTGRGCIPWIQRLNLTVSHVNHWTSPAHACLNPQLLTQMITMGMFNCWDGADHDDSDCIVSWGANMVWTEGAFIAGEVNRSRDRAAKLIVIDPCFEHPLAAKADHFLGIRPGTDLALAMAWIRLFIEEDRYDHDFIKRWTTLPLVVDAETEEAIPAAKVFEGVDEHALLMWDEDTDAVMLMPDFTDPEAKGNPALDLGTRELTLLDGSTIQVTTAWEALKGRVADMTPARAAEICWLEAQDIVDAFRTYADAERASIAMMQGVEEHTNCRLLIHAIDTIMGLGGNIDIKGGNVWHQFWNDMQDPSLTTMPTEYHAQNKLGNEGAFYNNSTGHGVWDAILTGKPYKVHAFIGIQGNPVSWCENPDRVVEAFKAIDFLVINDYYLSPAAQLADIVLPAAHWTERDFIADEFCQEWFYGQQKAVEPLYERKSDIELCRLIGKRLAPDQWPDDVYGVLNIALKKYGITYEELKEEWCMHLYPYREKKYETEGFRTPTRKAEFYSTVFAHAGRKDPLIRWEPPKESYETMPAEVIAEFPLILSTGRRYVNFYHSAYRGVPVLRELSPEPHFMINPTTAADLGIEPEEWCLIESPSGTRPIRMRAHVTAGVHPRVIIAPHGWWQGCKELGLPDYPDNSSNINCLISDQKYDPDLATPGMRSSLCKITKIQ
ncbi:molybdopterin-dependent oxidoreductase [Adlercreutzia equolifaciens]|uniref:molybdopterin-containing oxidoreductase family protein n=1 Tax=Adlercreutzia equolifaciens TaxID=446660 RepID=UPI0023B160D5|nr:molybdopterin-dependent oxidoreductase [Adlercreutzia equolifaciens]MDE8703280.1 molybdopterin-dependent oxidoreductase [Adlercreutzia equolifaciens]